MILTTVERDAREELRAFDQLFEIAFRLRWGKEYDNMDSHRIGCGWDCDCAAVLI